LRHSRRGFTLIEIVVVIGIIMLLIGLLIGGYRHINATAARRETVAELKTYVAMLTEYENHAGTAGSGSNAVEADNPNPQIKDLSAPSGTPQLFPIFLDPLQNGNPTRLTQVMGTGANPYWPCLQINTLTSNFSTDMGDHSSSSMPRYACEAVGKTMDLAYILIHMPANRTEFQNFPPKRLLEVPPSASGSPTTPPNLNQAVILDGWGNPIVIVPKGGIHVTISTSGTTQNYLVRSTGTTLLTSSTDPPMTGSERPFFASAGQDGDFTKGEDNIYSFQE
jgi:type II secretory pathway pseudopilin PulG